MQFDRYNVLISVNNPTAVMFSFDPIIENSNSGKSNEANLERNGNRIPLKFGLDCEFK